MTIESFKDANLAILDVYADGLPDWTHFQLEKLRGIVASPIPPEQVSHFTEFAFANRAALSTNALALAAEVSGFAAANGFYGLGEDARGFRIAASLRGEEVPEPPEPKAEWIEPLPVDDSSADAPAPAEPPVPGAGIA